MPVSAIARMSLKRQHVVLGPFADTILVHNSYRLQLDGPSLRKLRAKTNAVGKAKEDQE